MIESRIQPAGVGPAQDIGKILVVANAHGSSSRRAIPALANITDKYPRHVLPTFFTHEGHEDTVEDIGETIVRDSDITHCVAIGGENTVRITGEALFRLLIATGRQITALPLHGGNANDVATMLNGHKLPANPSELLAHGPVHTIAPIIGETRVSEEVEQHIAFGYIGIGATAYASHLLNHRHLRRFPGYQNPKVRKVLDLGIAGLTVAKAQPFNYLPPDENEMHQQIDLTFLNGTIMGKRRLVGPDNRHDLNQLGIFRTGVRTKQFTEVAEWLNGALHHNIPGEVLQKPCEFFVSPRGGEPLYMQVDGDPLAITDPTYVRISQAEAGVRFIGAKLG
jgi:hypothetical protein